MSEQSTPVDERLFQYIESHTTGEDDFLVQLKKEARTAGLPAIWISPGQAAFLQILLRAVRAQSVVEVGTLAGYSGIVMARALPDNGRLITIELEESHAAFAEKWIGRSDVAGKIQLKRGAAIDVLKTLPDDSADVVFLDADKASYPLYLREGLRILHRGGVLLADNALAHGELFDPASTNASAIAMKAFNEVIVKEKALQSVIVPLGDGIWVGVRR
jgi:caffeoyl-CoA O-methyltransferase